MKLLARGLVIVCIIAWLLTVLSALTKGSFSPVWWSAITVFIVAWILARIVSRDIAEKRAADLDEYEAALRHRARTVGYWTAILGGTALFLFLSVVVGGARSGNTAMLFEAPALVLSLVFAVSAVPTVTLAWNMRSHSDST